MSFILYQSSLNCSSLKANLFINSLASDGVLLEEFFSLPDPNISFDLNDNHFVKEITDVYIYTNDNKKYNSTIFIDPFSR